MSKENEFPKELQAEAVTGAQLAREVSDADAFLEEAFGGKPSEASARYQREVLGYHPDEKTVEE